MKPSQKAYFLQSNGWTQKAGMWIDNCVGPDRKTAPLSLDDAYSEELVRWQMT